MLNFWNKNYKNILLLIAGISLILAVVSGYQISNGNFADFTPLLFWFGLPYGAFVWGDLFTFSILWVVISLILIRIKNPRFFWIAFFSFWLIRSLGEANYWFLQQFHPETIPWPEYFNRIWIFKNLTDPEFWVFSQIGHQLTAVLSLFGIIYNSLKVFKEE